MQKRLPRVHLIDYHDKNQSLVMFRHLQICFHLKSALEFAWTPPIMEFRLTIKTQKTQFFGVRAESALRTDEVTDDWRERPLDSTCSVSGPFNSSGLRRVPFSICESVVFPDSLNPAIGESTYAPEKTVLVNLPITEASTPR
uniref:Uncharacterized protein n=1 Tax=Steinernema glaseri TaxID=37863 RepID=A0A1I8ACA0_9BILA